MSQIQKNYQSAKDWNINLFPWNVLSCRNQDGDFLRFEIRSCDLNPSLSSPDAQVFNMKLCCLHSNPQTEFEDFLTFYLEESQAVTSVFQKLELFHGCKDFSF